MTATETYETIRNEALNTYKDKNCCVPVAIALALGISYKQSYLLCKKFGRVHGKGMVKEVYIKALSSVGVEIHKRTTCFDRGGSVNGNLGKIRRASKLFLNSPVLVWSTAHVACYNNGRVLDNDGGKRKRFKGLAVLNLSNFDRILLPKGDIVVPKAKTPKYTLKYKDEIVASYNRRPKHNFSSPFVGLVGRPETDGKLVLIQNR